MESRIVRQAECFESATIALVAMQLFVSFTASDRASGCGGSTIHGNLGRACQSGLCAFIRSRLCLNLVLP